MKKRFKLERLPQDTAYWIALFLAVLLGNNPPVVAEDVSDRVEHQASPRSCKGLDGATCSYVARQAIRYANYYETTHWLEVFEDACKYGDPLGCAWLHREFMGPPVSLSQKKQLEISCASDDSSACLARALIFHREGGGRGTKTKRSQKEMTELKKAIEFYQKGCDLGEGKACFELGGIYERGEGVVQSFARSADFNLKACEENEGPACCDAGDYFSSGKGVKKSITKALELFQKGCSVDHGCGCNKVAEIYHYGEGEVSKSIQKAKEFYAESCFFAIYAGDRREGCFWLSGLKNISGTNLPKKTLK